MAPVQQLTTPTVPVRALRMPATPLTDRNLPTALQQERPVLNARSAQQASFLSVPEQWRCRPCRQSPQPYARAVTPTKRISLETICLDVRRNTRKCVSVRNRPFSKRTSDRYPGAGFTYGSVTTPARKTPGIEKSHVDAAAAITGAQCCAEPAREQDVIIQVRTKKRKEKNRTRKRKAENTTSVQGFHIGGKARAGGRTGYITGFTGNNAYIRDAGGSYIAQPRQSPWTVPSRRYPETLLQPQLGLYAGKDACAVPSPPTAFGA